MRSARPPSAILVAMGLSACGHIWVLPQLALTPQSAGPSATHTAAAQVDTMPMVVRRVQPSPAISHAPLRPSSTFKPNQIQQPVELGHAAPSALPPEVAPSSQNEQAVADALPSEPPGSAAVYWSPRDVDRLALPIAPPDLAWLDGHAWQGGPIRVRLAISAQGQVSEIDILLAPVGAEAVLSALQTALRATPFMPARKAGQDVASVQDIELEPAIP